MQASLRTFLVIISGATVIAGTSIVHSQHVSDHLDSDHTYRDELAHLPSHSCIEVTSSGSFSCKDAGNYDSTCATATCPADYTLVGGGGACNAGDRKIKSLFPRLSTGQYTIACESQGVAPTAVAICCAF